MSVSEPTQYVAIRMIAKATRWMLMGDHPKVKKVGENLNTKLDKDHFYLDDELTKAHVNPDDWILEFPDGRMNVVSDARFKTDYVRYKPATKNRK